MVLGTQMDPKSMNWRRKKILKWLLLSAKDIWFLKFLIQICQIWLSTNLGTNKIFKNFQNIFLALNYFLVNLRRNFFTQQKNFNTCEKYFEVFINLAKTQTLELTKFLKFTEVIFFCLEPFHVIWRRKSKNFPIGRFLLALAKGLHCTEEK